MFGAAEWSRGARREELGEVLDTNIVELSDLDWRVLEPLKREFAVDEIARRIRGPRAPPKPDCRSTNSFAWRDRSTSAA